MKHLTMCRLSPLLLSLHTIGSCKAVGREKGEGGERRDRVKQVEEVPWCGGCGRLSSMQQWKLWWDSLRASLY